MKRNEAGGYSFFPVHALTLYSSPYDSDIAVLFEKNMESILKIRSFHSRLGGPKHSLSPPLMVLGGMVARSHIRQVSIKFRIMSRQPIAGRLDTSSPPANSRPAAQDSGAWRHSTAERIVVCLVATRGTDTVRFFGYQKFCDFYIVIIACEVYSLKRNRVW